MASHKFRLTPQIVPKVKTNNRIIDSQIPAPGTEEIFRTLENVESRSMHGQLPIAWHKAQGASVYDIVGNKWIDFTYHICCRVTLTPE